MADEKILIDGAKLEKLRKELQLPQKFERPGLPSVSDRTIRDLERGNVKVATKKVAQSIAAHLNISVGDLELTTSSNPVPSKAVPGLQHTKSAKICSVSVVDAAKAEDQEMYPLGELGALELGKLVINNPGIFISFNADDAIDYDDETNKDLIQRLEEFDQSIIRLRKKGVEITSSPDDQQGQSFAGIARIQRDKLQAAKYFDSTLDEDFKKRLRVAVVHANIQGVENHGDEPSTRPMSILVVLLAANDNDPWTLRFTPPEDLKEKKRISNYSEEIFGSKKEEEQ